ncbi:MAG: sugar ABC transporter permease [Anaerolineales bacterium]|nr:sugar ABC transporter permease [Anaerolineales bacterium]
MNTVSYFKKQFQENMQTYAIILALGAIWILFSILTGGRYMGAQNFSNLFRQMTVTSFLSVGMVLIIVTGNIDLSVGKFAGFVSVMVAHYQAYVWYDLIPDQPALAAFLSILIGLGVGLIFGVIQGYLIAYLRIPSFIVTLGFMWIFNGLILVRTEGKTIPANQPIFSSIAQGYLPLLWGWILALFVVGLLYFMMFQGRRNKRRYGFELDPLTIDMVKTSIFALLILVYVLIVNQYNGVQLPVLLLAITAVVFSYVTTDTPLGRYTYAIGGNSEAARLSGVNIQKNVFMVFVLMGLLCGISGIMLASYVGYGTVAAGQGYELDAIASCILGGTSTLGGVGTVFGAMVGSLIMASLTNGLQILNVKAAWQYVLKGIVLVIAVYADVYLKKKS